MASIGPESVDLDPEPPGEYRDAARRLFGDRLALARRYAELLMTGGVVRGLIGPREAPRIWERHLLNCAAISELIPPGSTVVDVGSGAGLPGIVLAIARPDLSVALVEPLARRTSFLTEVVDELGLDRVAVVRSRAEDASASVGLADVVVARALASLDRLAAWCLPLAAPGGRVLAMKGELAAAELDEHADAVARSGGREVAIRRCGVGVIDPPATVVEMVRGGPTARPAAGPAPKSSRRASPTGRRNPSRRSSG
jgi:16S rRNA (guanine527-N7)-methyltransferase